MTFFVKRFLKLLLVLSEYSPFALLWMLKAFCVDWLAGKWAFLKLPHLAGQIGLRHKKSEYLKEFGELYGQMNGFKIYIEPFASMNPVLRAEYVSSYKGLKISLCRPKLRLEKNIIDFKTSNWKFNQIFRTIRVHKDIANRVKNNHDLIKSMVSFYMKWIFKLDALIIEENRAYCSLKYGFNFFPYIPVSTFKKLTQEFIELIEKLDMVPDRYQKKGC